MPTPSTDKIDFPRLNDRISSPNVNLSLGHNPPCVFLVGTFWGEATAATFFLKRGEGVARAGRAQGVCLHDLAIYTHRGESVARPQPERSESSSSTKSATECLRAPKSVLRRSSPHTDPHILPTFLQVDNTHLQVGRVGTAASLGRVAMTILCTLAAMGT